MSRLAHPSLCTKSFVKEIAIKHSLSSGLCYNNFEFKFKKPKRRVQLKKVITLLLLLTVTTSIGCTGSFNLTKKVYDAHRSQSDKWADELFFLGCVILPVYGIATFADAVVFNSIEFWTGDNPVVLNDGQKTKFVNNKGEAVIVEYNDETDEIKLISSLANGETSEVYLQKSDAAVVAKDAAGNVLYSSVANADGGVSIYNDQMQVVKNFSAKDVKTKSLR